MLHRFLGGEGASQSLGYLPDDRSPDYGADWDRANFHTENGDRSHCYVLMSNPTNWCSLRAVAGGPPVHHAHPSVAMVQLTPSASSPSSLVSVPALSALARV